MLSHTGERPYACSDSSCGRKFTKRNSWKSHQAKHNKGVDSAGQSSDETIGRQVLNSVNPDEIRLTTVPSVDGVQGKLKYYILIWLNAVLLIFLYSIHVAYAVIPLSAESVNRMTKRSGLSLQQLLNDRNLALQPCDSNESASNSSHMDEDISDSSLGTPIAQGNS